MVKKYLRGCYDIEKRLSDFIPIANVAYFREAQRATGTLIGGSFALQFFARVDYKTSDLDLYVHQLFAEDLITVLHTLGCERLSPQEPVAPSVYSPMANQVTNFLSPTARAIQVVVTYCRPVQAILAYHSTAVMNFLSGWYGYSLYGTETLDDSLSMYLCFDGGERHGAKSKYEQRGWRTIADRDTANKLSIFTPLPRLVGDEKTWIVKLDASTTYGVHGYQDPFIRDASWMLRVSGSGHSYISAL
ncbi:hypothetical protein CCMSSC00406_0005925 [Pleurotus cornucopiae]|uniref:Uncharacterized protein n=1 Tax=Pleurotus cornucopiae TaxID=5321 RepID=A0ACB7IKL9_PLECO|nr:hypothetical protein CCMSSC00406_0005925 [Pleurotus cornucopiae]